MTCITVYTDASLCQETKIGGWSCWIKYGKGETIMKSGPFKDVSRCSTEAELKAIANAMIVVSKLIAPKQSIIVCVTDSANAIRRIQGRNSAKAKKAGPVLESIAKFIRDMTPACCELRMKKVTAHSNADGKRSYVNGLVDKAARENMRRKRKERVAA